MLQDPALRRLATSTTLIPPNALPIGSRGTVLTEALRLFAERGYGSASIRDIAKSVGIKNASLYSLYPSKAHVLAELIDIGHRVHFHRLADALRRATPDPQSRLIALVRAHVLAHAEFAMLAVVSNAELHCLEPAFAGPILDLRRRSEKLLADVIREGVVAGAFHVPDETLAASAIAAMGLRVAHWYDPQGDTAPDRIADAYAEFACRIVGLALDSAPALTEDSQ